MARRHKELWISTQDVLAVEIRGRDREGRAILFRTQSRIEAKEAPTSRLDVPVTRYGPTTWRLDKSRTDGPVDIYCPVLTIH